jgi:hypothetical protein
METARVFCRPAFVELLDTQYPLYQKIVKRNPRNIFVRGQDEINFQHPLMGEVVDRLRSWQKKWNLVENDTSEEWVVRFLVDCGFAHWAASPPSVRHSLLFRPQNSALKYDEPEPFKRSFIYYDKIYETPYAPFSKDEYIQDAVDAFRKHARAYANEIDNQLKLEQWKVQAEISVRDLEWTVRSQMMDHSYSELAELGKIKADRNSKLLKTDEASLKEHTFTVKPVHVSTVKRAVERMLNLINIIPRQKRMDKRPRRPGNKNIHS